MYIAKKMLASHANGHSAQSSAWKQSVYMCKSSFILVCAFCICWGPYCIVLLVDFADDLPMWLHLWVTYLAHLHSAINWLIYWLTNKKFRQAIVQMLGNMKCGCCPCFRRILANVSTESGTNVTASTCSGPHLPDNSDQSVQSSTQGFQRVPKDNSIFVVSGNCVQDPFQKDNKHIVDDIKVNSHDKHGFGSFGVSPKISPKISSISCPVIAMENLEEILGGENRIVEGNNAHVTKNVSECTASSVIEHGKGSLKSDIVSGDIDANDDIENNYSNEMIQSENVEICDLSYDTNSDATKTVNEENDVFDNENMPCNDEPNLTCTDQPIDISRKHWLNAIKMRQRSKLNSANSIASTDSDV